MSVAELEQTESRILELSRNGDLPAARDASLAAAEEALQLAGSSADEAQRKRLLELSDAYRRLAADLAAPRPRPRSERPAAPKPPAQHQRRTTRASEANQQWQIAERPDITLADVAGMEDLKQLVWREIVMPISYPELGAALNIPHGLGVLLYGPPGTGKTHFARALAGELDCAFFVIEPAGILSKWVGESEQRLTALMAQAKCEPRAIVYVDEIAEMFPRRGSGSIYSDRLVGVFLQALDGFEQSDNLLLTIGATNHPARIDQTLIRSGRLGQHIYVGLPDCDARQAILGLEMRDVPHEEFIDLESVARQTAGYSAADVVAVAREARKQARDRIVAARSNNDHAGAATVEVTSTDFVAALAVVHPAVPDPAMLAEIEQFRLGRM